MPRQLSLAVVGADFPNKKGPTRRFEIALCVPGEEIYLIPEPKNPADPQAVAVFSQRNIQIGYVSAERAPLVQKLLRTAPPVLAIFQCATHYGAAIRVGYDGQEPQLPEPDDSRANPWPPPGSDDADWWPDETFDD